MRKAIKRRNFIQKSLATIATLGLGPWIKAEDLSKGFADHESKPWIELSKAAYLHNAAQISRMATGRPIIAVLKNNAYGLGAVEVGRILDDSKEILGMAVVKDEVAVAMRRAGVTKPILLMGDFDRSLGNELVEKDITLSIHSSEALEKVNELLQRNNRSIKVALYIDTGLGRMGIPYQKALDIAKRLRESPSLKITQIFTTLTTPRDFATLQIEHFQQVISSLLENGTRDVESSLKHLAPSFSILDIPTSHQDAVRPGILLHGSFPLAKMAEAETYPLEVTYRLKAPVIRLEKLKAGDTIGFSRFYHVEKDEWIATLPIGWADGYNSGAENGAKVLLEDRLFPVVNVNASHTNIALGSDTNLKVGEVATLIGPDHPDLTPEGFGKLVDGHNYLQINYKESITKRVYETF